MWARPNYRIPVLIGLLAALLAFAWAITTLSGSASFRTQFLAGRAQYVAAAGSIHRGGILAASDLKLSYVTSTDDYASIYFGAAEEQSLVGKVIEADLQPGQLVPRGSVVSAGTANYRKVPVTFAIAPQLHAGDVVDILVIGDDSNARAVHPFLSQVTLYASGTGGWLIDVPAGQASALIYAAANLKLAAVADVPGSSAADLGSIESQGQAVRAVGGQ